MKFPCLSLWRLGLLDNPLRKSINPLIALLFWTGSLRLGIFAGKKNFFSPLSTERDPVCMVCSFPLTSCSHYAGTDAYPFSRNHFLFLRVFASLSKDNWPQMRRHVPCFCLKPFSVCHGNCHFCHFPFLLFELFNESYLYSTKFLQVRNRISNTISHLNKTLLVYQIFICKVHLISDLLKKANKLTFLIFILIIKSK